jgi:hypothetical protein
LVGLFSVPLIFDAVVPDCPPVSPPVTEGAAQLNVVPAGTMPFTPLVGVTVNAIPLQVVAVIAVIVVTALIVIVSVNVAPAPQLVNGVTIYVAVTAALVVFTSCPVILLDAMVCDCPPVKPVPVGNVHV